MHFTLENTDNAKLITHYDNGIIEVEGKSYQSGLYLNRQKVTLWQENDAKALTLESLSQVILDKPEILVLGTGAKLTFPEIALIAQLQQQGTVIETMNTAAACRTYNILASENRSVAAALMKIE